MTERRRAKPGDRAGRHEADSIFSTAHSLLQEPTDLSVVNLHSVKIQNAHSTKGIKYKSYPPDPIHVKFSLYIQCLSASLLALSKCSFISIGPYCLHLDS